MNRLRKFFSLGAVLLVLALLGSDAHALDMWVNVLEMGHDDPRMNQTQAMAIYGNRIYVASQPDPLESPRILRAMLREDNLWSDFTPLGGLPTYPITDMIVVNGALYVSVSDQLWRLDEPDNILSWRPVFLPGPAAPILALGSVMRADTHRAMLCLLRGATDVHTLCFFEDLDRWHEFGFPGTARPRTVGSGHLQGQRQVLWAGLGGTTRGSGPCVVAKYSDFRVRAGLPEASMDLLTDDCFGTGVAFLTPAVFRDLPYFAVSGTSGNGFGIFRLDRGAPTPRDVTPWALFCPGSDPCDNPPASIGSMAVSGGALYLGIRQNPLYSPREAIVLATADGENWFFSSESGFGRDNNANISSMTGKGCALYAGTLKLLGSDSPGFEVWRRGLIPADLGCIGDIESRVRREWQRIQTCLLTRRNSWLPPRFEVVCLPDFLRLAESIEAIDIALAKVIIGDPQEKMLVDEMRILLDPALAELEQAKVLIILADSGKSPEPAQTLRKQAAVHLREAVNIVHTTAVRLKTALQNAGGSEIPAFPQDPPVLEPAFVLPTQAVTLTSNSGITIKP
jgi:hypothetical protein